MLPNIDDIFICLDDKCDIDNKVTTNTQGLFRHKAHSVQMFTRLNQIKSKWESLQSTISIILFLLYL